jgi:hypothetical protein
MADEPIVSTITPGVTGTPPTPEPTPGITPAEPVKTPGEPGTPAAEPEPIVEPAGAKPHGAEERIRGLVAKTKDIERERDYWHSIATEGKPAGETRTPAPSAMQPPEPPDINKFDDYQEYEAAKDKYLIDMTTFNVRQNIRLEAQRGMMQKIDDTFNERLKKAAETEPEVLDYKQDTTLPVSPAMAIAIKESEKGPEIILYLGRNRNESARIASMNPFAAAKEIGRIEAGFLKAPAPTPPKVISQAPEPITTVISKGTVTVDEEKLPIDDWVARRNKAQYAGKPRRK